MSGKTDRLCLDHEPVAEAITLIRALYVCPDLSPMPSPMGAKEEGRAHHQLNHVELVPRRVSGFVSIRKS